MSEGGPAEIAGLQIGDKIMQVQLSQRRKTRFGGEGLKHLGLRANLASQRSNSLRWVSEAMLLLPLKKLVALCTTM